jgi:arsenical pump membrane protein
VGFLGALLVLAEGCRREGLFDAIGALMGAGARASPRRLLRLVFCVATAVTAVLGLDATVVLLTPIVFATAATLRTSPRPHVYACSHLANSASLWLPVSNLTNLLAFDASGLSFTRFAALMTLPTLAVVAIEWLVFARFFATDRDRPRPPRAAAKSTPACAALLANLVNNLPATLALVPVAAASGPAAVLAVLIGVNVGPNLTYAGSWSGRARSEQAGKRRISPNATSRCDVLGLENRKRRTAG